MKTPLIRLTIFAAFFAVPAIVWGQAAWQEPNCDPSTDPSSCNVAAPLNVSAANQQKTGSLTIGGTLQADSNLTLSSGGTLSLPNNAVTDAMVADTVAAGKFIRSTGIGATEAVDLGAWSATADVSATTEVTGLLPAAAISDNWVNVNGDSMSGTLNILVNSATTSTRGLEIEVGSGAQVAIEATSNSTSGIALQARSFGTASTGVYASASGTAGYFYNDGNQGVALEAYNPDGVAISATRDSGAGAAIEANYSGSLGYGVYGYVDILGAGVLGRTFGAGPSTFGVEACQGTDTNCAYLGGNNWSAKFKGDAYVDGQLIANDVKIANEQRTEDRQSELGNIISTYQPGDSGILFTWNNPIFVANNDSEIWVVANNSDNTLTDVVGLSADTDQVIARSRLNDAGGATAAALTNSGIYVATNKNDLVYWSFADSVVETLADDIGSANAMAVSNNYVWLGSATVGTPSSSLLTRVNRSNGNVETVGNSIGLQGYEVKDFVYGDDDVYLYALVTTNEFSSDSVKQQVWQIQTITNQIVRKFDLAVDEEVSVVANDMTYDGSSIWVTGSGDTSDYDYLFQIQIVDNFGFPGDFEVEQKTFALGGPTETNATDINRVIFDGQYLWLTADRRGQVIRMLPFVEIDNPNREIFLDDATDYISIQGGVSNRYAQISSNGDYLWGLQRSGSGTVTLKKMSTGTLAKKVDTTAIGGITIYNRNASLTEPDPYCLSVNGPKGSGTLQVTSGVCENE